MILINNFSISSDRTKINISVETSDTETITNIDLWSDITFKDYSQNISLNSKLTTSNSETLEFTNSELGLSLIHI